MLDYVPVALARNVVRGGLRSGMTVIRTDARGRVHSISGELAKGLTVGTRIRDGRVTASLKTKGKHGRVGHLVEFGTRPHAIMAKVKAGLSFAGVVVAKILHPGAKPKPFMRPALERAPAALVATGLYMREKLATKAGLDTAYIKIEADE